MRCRSILLNAKSNTRGQAPAGLSRKNLAALEMAMVNGLVAPGTGVQGPANWKSARAGTVSLGRDRDQERGRIGHRRNIINTRDLEIEQGVVPRRLEQTR